MRSRLVFAFGALMTAPWNFAAFGQGSGATPKVEVKTQEDVYTFVSPNNGSGPLWCYGCTQIVRMGEEVVVSQMETGHGVPPLCNTRWRLLRRTKQGWRMFAEAQRYRQREPCPLAITSDKDLFVYVNDSTEPPGTKYGPCKPYLLRFTFGGKALERTMIVPSWPGEPYFTDHSYRGYGADPARGELLMLNIDARTSVQHACLLSGAGETLANGSITYPIRACYPQVALDRGAVHVLAIGDIVEPVEEWRKYKFEQTQRAWDYVFRILYYAWTPNLREQDFAAPIEIANVDETAGHISNCDLWVSPEGEGYILYTQREVQSALLRDKFFPDKSITNSLRLAVVKDGRITARRTLVAGTDTCQPGTARFHVTPAGTLYAIVYMSGEGAGNKLLQVYPAPEKGGSVPIPLEKPMSSFCLATVRAGNRPSNTIDLFGHTAGDTLSYAQVVIE